MRVLCLLVPLFPLAARLRSEPELLEESVAVTVGNGSAARIIAATRAARTAGIRPGLTLPQARALLPDLIVRPRDTESERAAQETLTEIAESFSPRIESSGEGVSYLDISNSRPSSSRTDDELDLAHSIMLHAARQDLPVWTGVGSSKLTAHIAAQLPGSPHIVPEGSEADFLAPLPLSRLAPETETALTLQRWGLSSIGDFARLPKSEVASRLGPTGRELHQRARGLDPGPLVPHRSPPGFREGMELEWPLVQLEPFLFIARAALERLCKRLEAHGLACAQLDISLDLEPSGHHERSIRLPAPTLEIKTLLTVLRLDLEASSPRAPLIGFALTAHPDAPRQAQLSLFGPTTLMPDRLATTLARLFSLLGKERVGSPRAVDGHRPERFEIVEYQPPPPPKEIQPIEAGRGLMAVRVVRPPLEIEVLTEEKQTGCPPKQLHSVAHPDADRRMRIDGRVKVASGPWALEERWWTDDPADRDYWDIEMENGGLYRIFRDNRTATWFADGIYD